MKPAVDPGRRYALARVRQIGLALSVLVSLLSAGCGMFWYRVSFGGGRETDGAEVWIDGSYRGKMKLNVTDDPGIQGRAHLTVWLTPAQTYRVEIRKPGYVTETMELYVAEVEPASEDSHLQYVEVGPLHVAAPSD